MRKKGILCQVSWVYWMILCFGFGVCFVVCISWVVFWVYIVRAFVCNLFFIFVLYRKSLLVICWFWKMIKGWYICV